MTDSDRPPRPPHDRRDMWVDEASHWSEERWRKIIEATGTFCSDAVEITAPRQIDFGGLHSPRQIEKYELIFVEEIEKHE